jgi:hypothetical protein
MILIIFIINLHNIKIYSELENNFVSLGECADEHKGRKAAVRALPQTAANKLI